MTQRSFQQNNLYVTVHNNSIQVTLKHSHRMCLYEVKKSKAMYVSLKSNNKEVIDDTKKSLFDRILQSNIMYSYIFQK